MVDVVPEGTYGRATIKHVTVSKQESAMTAWGGYRSYVPVGTYAQLFVDGEMVMSDTRYERLSNRAAVEHAHGDVLIAGLGLGMILWPILAKPDVNRVFVVEIEQDVIDLIEPTLKAHPTRSKLNIERGNILAWRPNYHPSFGAIWFDIWADACEDNLGEITMLHRRAWRWLDKSDPDRWMGSWDAEYLRARRDA
jgi:hypothetical protein